MAIFFNFKGKFNEAHMSRFCKGMYYLLRGNVNIVESLNIISQGYDEKRKKKILAVKSSIEKGKTLENSFKEINLSKDFLQMIKIGENTGNITTTFENLYKKYEFNNKIKNEIKSLSIYPTLVLLTAFVILLILLKVVVPKFISIYDGLGQELPNITKFVINISNFLNKYFLFMLIFCFFICFIVKIYVNKNKEKFELMLVKMPIISRMFKEIKLLNFTQNMSILLKSKITLIEALIISNNGDEGLFKNEINQKIVRLKRGEEITKVFRKSNFFDREYVSFLKIGENTGNMEESFSNLLEIYYNRVNERIKLFLKVLEPLSIIVIGLIVGFVVFAVMMPIFKMSEGL